MLKCLFDKVKSVKFYENGTTVDQWTTDRTTILSIVRDIFEGLEVEAEIFATVLNLISFNPHHAI